MKTSSNLALVDTNVLVYAVEPTNLQHQQAKTFSDNILNGIIPSCLALQVAVEFFSVVTSPKRVANPRTPQQAIAQIEKYQKAGIPFLKPPVDFEDQFLQLLKQTPVKAAEIFDLQLAALMLANGVDKVYTYDDTVFSKVKGITVLTP